MIILMLVLLLGCDKNNFSNLVDKGDGDVFNVSTNTSLVLQQGASFGGDPRLKPFISYNAEGYCITTEKGGIVLPPESTCLDNNDSIIEDPYTEVGNLYDDATLESVASLDSGLQVRAYRLYDNDGSDEYRSSYLRIPYLVITRLTSGGVSVLFNEELDIYGFEYFCGIIPGRENIFWIVYQKYVADGEQGNFLQAYQTSESGGVITLTAVGDEFDLQISTDDRVETSSVYYSEGSHLVVSTGYRDESNEYVEPEIRLIKWNSVNSTYTEEQRMRLNTRTVGVENHPSIDIDQENGVVFGAWQATSYDGEGSKAVVGRAFEIVDEELVEMLPETIINQNTVGDQQFVTVKYIADLGIWTFFYADGTEMKLRVMEQTRDGWVFIGDEILVDSQLSFGSTIVDPAGDPRIQAIYQPIGELSGNIRLFYGVVTSAGFSDNVRLTKISIEIEREETSSSSTSLPSSTTVIVTVMPTTESTTMSSTTTESTTTSSTAMPITTTESTTTSSTTMPSTTTESTTTSSTAMSSTTTRRTTMSSTVRPDTTTGEEMSSSTSEKRDNMTSTLASAASKSSDGTTIGAAVGGAVGGGLVIGALFAIKKFFFGSTDAEQAKSKNPVMNPTYRGDETDTTYEEPIDMEHRVVDGVSQQLYEEISDTPLDPTIVRSSKEETLAFEEARKRAMLERHNKMFEAKRMTKAKEDETRLCEEPVPFKGGTSEYVDPSMIKDSVNPPANYDTKEAYSMVDIHSTGREQVVMGTSEYVEPSMLKDTVQGESSAVNIVGEEGTVVYESAKEDRGTNERVGTFEFFSLEDSQEVGDDYIVCGDSVEA